MAKSNITLDIGTSYKGEGFKKLNQALNGATGSTRRASSQWAKMHQSAAKTASTAWTEFYSKMKVLTGAIKTAWNGVKLVMSKSFAFETQTMQFKTLVGNIDEARKHMADLKTLGDTPPFSLDEFARASRQMMVMTDGILGYKDSLKLVGDAAAATGNDLESISHAVGRLYAFIRDGEPIGRAANELRNMGILTPAVVTELKNMQEAGASSVEIWAKVEEALSRYNGAMEETEKTGNGLMGAISSRWDNIVRQFGDAFKDTAEGGMKDMLEAMENLESSGFANWLGNTLVSAATKAINAFASLYSHLKQGRDFWNGVEEGADAAAEAVERELQSEEKINAWKTKRTYKRSDGGIEEEYEINEDLKRSEEEKERKMQALREADEKRAADKAKKDAEAKAKAEADAKKKRDDEIKRAEDRYWKKREAELDEESREFERAMKAEEDAKKAALKQVERNRMNAQKDAVRQAGAKTLRDIDNQIQQAQNEAQVLEENAQRARGGKTFGEWQRGERDLAREQRIADNRQKNVVNNAEKELARLEANARRGKAFTNAHDKARMAKLREFIADQDPNNNPALKKAKELEEKRRKLEEKMQKDIDTITKKMEKLGL